MTKTMRITLLALLAIAFSCCNNEESNCFDCEALDKAVPAFEKKFSEKKVNLDPEYIRDGRFVEMTFSSFEEAEFKLSNCFYSDNFPSYLFSNACFDMTKKVIKSDTTSMCYPFHTLVNKIYFNVVESDDGQVRCYGWRHLDGAGGMQPILMVQYKGSDGKVHVVEGRDFDEGNYVPEDKYSIYPEKIFRIHKGKETYTIIWGIYGSSVGEEISYYGLIALRMDDSGVHSVNLFKDDEVKDNIDVSYCIDYFEDDNYELIRFNEEEPSFCFPNYYEKYVWDGDAFVLQRRDEKESLQLILTSIADGDKETFADLVRYPLCRQYPLRDIWNKNEMIKYFDFLFDDSFRKIIGSLKISDWGEVGWRGNTVLSGELWEDGGELKAVSYSSPVEQRLRDSLIKAEFDALHPSLQGNWEPVDRLEFRDDVFTYARIDKCLDEYNLYRLCLFAKDAKLDDMPVACLSGYAQYEGNMGDGYYCFKSQDTVVYHAFGSEHLDCLPKQIWKSFSWMGREIQYRNLFYQIEYSF